MNVLTVQHKTVYRYPQPVRFGEHRLMFRPRDSHDLRLVSTRLTIEPRPSKVRWIHDVFGNSIAVATFDAPADTLVLESEFVAETYELDNINFPLDPTAETVPFSYSTTEIPDLARVMERHYPDPDGLLQAWVRGIVAESQAGPRTLSVLAAINMAIRERFAYTTRTTEGVQNPVETLALGSGTCRDFALFMMEACRSLGLAARFVTGYLYDPALDGGADEQVMGAGATHAWAQIYLPGAGWVEYDPTNGTIGGHNLVRVAVAREPAQAIPVQGTFFGPYQSTMEVDVHVTRAPDIMVA